MILNNTIDSHRLREQVRQEVFEGLRQVVREVQTVALNGEVLQRRSGALADSGRVEPVADGFLVRFGSDSVPYARIHEFGGVIYPKRARYLRIPLANGEQGDFVVRNQRGNLVVMKRDAGGARPVAVLAERVEMPRRPYLRPALERMLPKIAERALRVVAQEMAAAMRTTG